MSWRLFEKNYNELNNNNSSNNYNNNNNRKSKKSKKMLRLLMKRFSSSEPLPISNPIPSDFVTSNTDTLTRRSSSSRLAKPTSTVTDHIFKVNIVIFSVTLILFPCHFLDIRSRLGYNRSSPSDQ